MKGIYMAKIIDLKTKKVLADFPREVKTPKSLTAYKSEEYNGLYVIAHNLSCAEVIMQGIQIEIDKNKRKKSA